MTEAVADSAGDADDSAADEDTMPANEASEAELPNDYYVTLQPLTLDLIATQLERVGIKFTLYPDYIGAGWESFTLTIRVNNDRLYARAIFRDSRPASSIAAIIGRCNWWNAKRTFMKASAEVTTGQATKSDDSPLTIAIARVQLDMDLPLRAGVAPVQLQSLFREISGNVAEFEQGAQLNTLIPQSAWPWQ